MLQSPKGQSKSLIQNKRISNNIRPMSSHQQLSQFQQKQQQQQFHQSPNNQQQQTLQQSLNIARKSFQKTSVDSSPVVNDCQMRLYTSFPGSPSLSTHFSKNTQITWTPTEGDYSETRQHFTFQNINNSSPYFNSRIMVSGYNNQITQGDKSDQSGEIYVLHNSQGNKYRSKLNSQVKAKLNKKNEIIKQFLIKNMKPNENNGFQKWIESQEQKSSQASQQNNDNKVIHKQTTTAYLLNKYKNKKQDNQNSINNPVMLGGQNRESKLNEKQVYKRPVTSFLQRSKILIPQTMASKDQISQKQITIKGNNQQQQIAQQQFFESKNMNIYSKPQKVDKANQSLDEEESDNFQLQIPTIIDNKSDKFYQKKPSSPEKSQYQSFSIQDSKFEQGNVDWGEDFYFNQNNQNQSSVHSSQQVTAINKSSGQKVFKNQTEQTNFPEQNFNSLVSFQDQSMDRERIYSNYNNEKGDPEDGQRFQSSEKQSRKVSSNIQVTIPKPTIQKLQQQQQQSGTGAQISQNSLKSQQVISTKKIKSISNIQSDIPRKKSIRGWSFVSEEDQQDNYTFRQIRKSFLNNN